MEIKLYNYQKNGEIAFFDKNGKHIISKEEVSLLLKQNEYDVMAGSRYYYTPFADYIKSKICKNKYTDIGLFAILEHLRNSNYRVTIKEVQKDNYHFVVTTTYEDDITACISVIRNDEDFGCYCKSEPRFEEFKNTISDQLDIQF